MVLSDHSAIRNRLQKGFEFMDNFTSGNNGYKMLKFFGCGSWIFFPIFKMFYHLNGWENVKCVLSTYFTDKITMKWLKLGIK